MRGIVDNIFLGVILIIFLIFAGQVSTAAQLNESNLTSCLSKAEKNRLIKKYGISGALSRSTESCEKSDSLNQVLNALNFIEKVRFHWAKDETHFPNQGIVREPYDQFIAKRGLKIQFWQGSAQRCTYACYSRGVVSLGPKFFQKDIMTQASALVHEARHDDDVDHATGGGHPHVFSCHSSSPDCDQNYSDKGAYAVQLEFLARVSRLSKNVDSRLQGLAGKQARTIASVKFVDRFEPKQKSFLILKSKNGIFSNHSVRFARYWSPRAGGQLIAFRNGYVVEWYPGQKKAPRLMLADPWVFVKNVWDISIDRQFNDFKRVLKSNPAEVYYDRGVFLTKTQDGQWKVDSAKLEIKNPQSFKASKATPCGEDGLFLVKGTGIFKVARPLRAKPTIEKIACPWPANTKQVVLGNYYQGKRDLFVLDNQGFAYRLEGERRVAINRKLQFEQMLAGLIFSR